MSEVKTEQRHHSREIGIKYAMFLYVTSIWPTRERLSTKKNFFQICYRINLWTAKAKLILYTFEIDVNYKDDMIWINIWYMYIINWDNNEEKLYQSLFPPLNSQSKWWNWFRSFSQWQQTYSEKQNLLSLPSLSILCMGIFFFIKIVFLSVF